MTDFQPPISNPTNNRFGDVDSAILQSESSIVGLTLGLLPPNTDSLGGTMTANGSQYERTTTTLMDPSTSKLVTVVRVWAINAAPASAPTATNAYNSDGSAYTGSIAGLINPTT